LFTGLERAGLATLVAFLFVFGIACMVASPTDVDLRDSLLVRIYSYWQQFAGIYAAMLESVVGFGWFGFIVCLWIDTFLRLRRDPLTVTRNMACFAGCFLIVILLRAPEDVGYIVDVIHRPVSVYSDGRAYFGAIADIGVRFFSLCILGAIVVFAGEISQLARQRIFHAEWMAGENAPEEERRKWYRREALILTARGPQSPLYSVILRLLALVIASFAGTFGIILMAEQVTDVGFGRLPAPLMTKTGPTAINPQRLVGVIRIDADGRVYLGNDLAVDRWDMDFRRLVGWLRRDATGPEKAFLLQVHSEVSLQRVVEVMSAADQAGVLLALEE